tara:strand:+ start:260 stop:418 length:159 start_codon:yes stop_codon:yes gene_type:complete
LILLNEVKAYNATGTNDTLLSKKLSSFSLSGDFHLVTKKGSLPLQQLYFLSK